MTLAFDRAGDGPPLVLLHGVGHRRQAWHPVLDRLTPHRDVIMVDLPGHGDSPPLRTKGPVVEEMLAEVLALFDELGLHRPHIAGNSLGGRIALEAARPARLRPSRPCHRPGSGARTARPGTPGPSSR